MTHRHRKRHHVSRALLISILSIALPSLAAERLELPEGFPLWQKSARVRVGVGYKDNVTLSSFDPQGSPFEITSAELMLFRLPWNNWQFSLMAVGSDARYFDDSVGVDAEQNAAVSSELAWFFGRGWKSSSTLQYAYINQVMDVSTTYGVSMRNQVRGHGLTFKEGVRKDFSPWWAEVTLSGSRYFFEEPLDDYYQFGPLLRLGRYYGHGSEISLQYQFSPLDYDTREQTDRAGKPMTGTSLRYSVQAVELSWQHCWDEQRRWRNLSRVGFESSEDNGSGYYDYGAWRATEQLRYRVPEWEISVQASVAYYRFPHQPAGLDDPSRRHRTSLNLTFRGERELSKHWRVYLACDYEKSFSNLDAEEYDASTFSSGIECAF